MTYATQQDMIDRFAQSEMIQLTNPDNPAATTVNATVIGKALADADAVIDGYLIGRYTLPLASTPVVLTRYACDLARYFLYDNMATEEVRRRHDDAIKFLELVSQGKISLGLDAAQAPTPTSDSVAHDANDPVFNKDTLADY